MKGREKLRMIFKFIARATGWMVMPLSKLGNTRRRSNTS